MKKHSIFAKALSVFTVAAILSSLCLFSVSASAEEISVGSPNYISYNKDFYNANTELCNTLVQGMENLQNEIDIEKYQLSINDVKSAMRTVSETSPELFYVSKTTYSLAIGTAWQGLCQNTPTQTLRLKQCVKSLIKGQLKFFQK